MRHIVERVIVPYNPSANSIINNEQYYLFAPIANKGKVGMAAFDEFDFDVKGHTVFINQRVKDSLTEPIEGKLNELGEVMLENSDAIKTNTDDIKANADEIKANTDKIKTNTDEIGLLIADKPKVLGVSLSDDYELGVTLFCGERQLWDTVKLPLADSIVDMTFNSAHKYIVFTQRDGTVSTVSLASLLRGLVTSLDSTDENVALSAPTGSLIKEAILASASEINGRVDGVEDTIPTKVSLEMDPTTHIITAKLVRGGTVIEGSSSQIDLPLEESVVDITFDNKENDIVLTLRNGATSRVPLDSLFRGVVTSLTDKSTDKALSAATGQLITDITDDLQRQIDLLSDDNDDLSDEVPDSIDVTLTDDYALKVDVKKGETVLYSDTENLPLSDMVTGVSYRLQDDGKSVDLRITLRDKSSYDIPLADIITAAKLNEILTSYSTDRIKEYYLTQTEGFVKLVEKGQNGSIDTITSEVAVIVPDGVTLRNNPATGRTEIYGVHTISGSVLKFYNGTRADFYDKYTADERRNTLAFFTDDDTREKFDMLMRWYEETHPTGLRLIDFRSSLDNLVYERGESVSQAMGFSYTFSKAPKTLTLNGDDHAISGATGHIIIPIETYTADTSWVLRGTGDEGEVAEGTVKLDFKPAVFYGVSTSPVCDSSIITSFTKVLSDEHLRSFSVKSDTDKFIYYCVPVSFDTVTPGKFQISGFGLPGGIQKQDYTVPYTYGTSTTNYVVYCTDYAGFGDRTVTIKSKEE